MTWGQWAANLLIAAPGLRLPYIDNVYWTLLLELTFYGWICLLMRGGALRQRIDAVVLVWLLVSLLNQVFLDSHAIRKIFLTDPSGFFATGVMLYELRAGRRDAAAQVLLGLAAAAAVLHAVSNVEMWRLQTGATFDDWTVAAISAGIIAVTAAAVRIRTMPLPAGLTLAVGGLTYPFYLLHQKLGYIALLRTADLGAPVLRAGLIIVATLVVSWATWKLVDRSLQRLTKRALGEFVGWLGAQDFARAKPQSPPPDRRQLALESPRARYCSSQWM